MKKGATADMAAALLCILNDQQIATKMRKASLRQFKQFSIKLTTDKLLVLYRQGIKRHGLTSRLKVRRARV